MIIRYFNKILHFSNHVSRKFDKTASLPENFKIKRLLKVITNSFKIFSDKQKNELD